MPLSLRFPVQQRNCVRFRTGQQVDPETRDWCRLARSQDVSRHFMAYLAKATAAPISISIRIRRFISPKMTSATVRAQRSRHQLFDGTWRAFVFGLFDSGCPSTVARFVISVVVDPIDTVIGGWASANIGQEVLVRVSPSFANSNATAPIVNVGFNALPKASIAHRCPRPELRRDFSAYCIGMSGVSFNVCSASQTTTGSRVSRDQAGIWKNLFNAAIAPPDVASMRLFLRSYCNCGEQSVSIAHAYSRWWLWHQGFIP
jgi:hypothetical protein